MKKIKPALLLFFMLIALTSTAFAVGNTSSHKFHYEGCRAEQRIRADHRVHFDSR